MQDAYNPLSNMLIRYGALYTIAIGGQNKLHY